MAIDTPSPWPLDLKAPAPVLLERITAQFEEDSRVHLDQARRMAGIARVVLVVLVVASLLAAAGDSFLAWCLVGAIAMAWAITLGTGGAALAQALTNAPMQRVIERLLPDFTTGQPLHLRLDPREPAEAGKAFRSATSPYSGAAKHHYRHRLLGVRGYTADGTLLALDLKRRVKVKGGSVIRDHIQLRGRLRPGPGQSTEGLEQGQAVPKLTIKRWGPGPEVAFLGQFATLEEALGQVAALLTATRSGGA